MRKVINWVLTPLVVLAFVGVLVVFEILGRLALLISLNVFEIVMAGLQWTMMRLFTVFGVRIRVERSSMVDRHRPYVIISNHQSLFDIALIGGVLFWNLPKYVAKQELTAGIPAVSLNLNHGRHALIDRKNADQAVTAIRELGRTSMERGTSAVIFPEGTRSRGGSLKKFRRNGAITLLGAAPELWVVPVTIEGSWHFNTIPPFPSETEIVMRIGDPMERTPDDEHDVFDRATAEIATTLEELRGH